MLVGRVAGPDGVEAGHGPRLGDPLVKDLAVGGLLVGQQHRVVHGLIGLPVGAVDLLRREHRVDAEGASLVGNDRDDPVAEVLDAEQLLQQPHERHGGGDL